MDASIPEAHSMPDWSYCTLNQPILERLPHDSARRFVNSFLGGMTRLPFGYKVIEIMGHMAPPEALELSLGSQTLSSPLIMAPAIDPCGRAAKAFAKFGFGALTLGPVSLKDCREPEFTQGAQTLVGSGGAALGLEACETILIKNSGLSFFVELALPLHSPSFDQDCEQFTERLGPHVAALVLSPQSYGNLEEGWQDKLHHFRDLCQRSGTLACFGLPESEIDQEKIAAIAQHCAQLGVALFLSGSRDLEDRWVWGGRFPATLWLVKELKSQAPQGRILADGGLLEPQEALNLMEAGADALIISAGLVHTGPGLPKRINQALLTLPRFQKEREEEKPRAPERMAWFWGALLGLAMLLGAGLAGWIALTDVVLPYDEEFCGLSASEIQNFNPRVLSFMTHDRVTLSGTMVSLGILYLALSWFEMRHGSHWAQRTIQISATSGFFTFFAFLGYGYFDPLHAMVTAILFQMLVQIMVLPTGSVPRGPELGDFVNDRAWRRGLWGQLLFVIHGSALILAGIVILSFGTTVIFVPEDIQYLGMNSQVLDAFEPKLRALIAHDRATFGGMLVSAGLALLFTSLWGFRKGAAWLWWTYLLVILTPYILTLWIHHDIGYWDQFHLAPVYIGLVLLVLGLWCSAAYLLSRPGGIEKQGISATTRPSEV